MQLLRSLAWIPICLAMVSTGQARAEFRSIHSGRTDRLIVFVHGLWGDPVSSFHADGAASSWPQLMAEDTVSVRGQAPLTQYAIGVLGYPASRSDRLSLPQIAANLATDLVDAGVLDRYKEVYFVAHSLGGLVVKEMLIGSSVARSSLVEHTCAVFLVSTPSQGAPAANFLKALPEALSGRLIADLSTIDANTYLQTLSNNWADMRRGRQDRPAAYCAHETHPVLGLTVVPQQYADANCSENPRAENGNHINIVKPTNRDAPIYGWVRGRIADLGVRKACRPDRVNASTQSKADPGPRGGPSAPEVRPILGSPPTQTVVCTTSGIGRKDSGNRGVGPNSDHGICAPIEQVQNDPARPGNKIFPISNVDPPPTAGPYANECTGGIPLIQLKIGDRISISPNCFNVNKRLAVGAKIE